MDADKVLSIYKLYNDREDHVVDGMDAAAQSYVVHFAKTVEGTRKDDLGFICILVYEPAQGIYGLRFWRDHDAGMPKELR